MGCKLSRSETLPLMTLVCCSLVDLQKNRARTGLSIIDFAIVIITFHPTFSMRESSLECVYAFSLGKRILARRKLSAANRSPNALLSPQGGPRNFLEIIDLSERPISSFSPMMQLIPARCGHLRSSRKEPRLQLFADHSCFRLCSASGDRFKAFACNEGRSSEQVSEVVTLGRV